MHFSVEFVLLRNHVLLSFSGTNLSVLNWGRKRYQLSPLWMYFQAADQCWVMLAEGLACVVSKWAVCWSYTKQPSSDKPHTAGKFHTASQVECWQFQAIYKPNYWAGHPPPLTLYFGPCFGGKETQICLLQVPLHYSHYFLHWEFSRDEWVKRQKWGCRAELFSWLVTHSELLFRQVRTLLCWGLNSDANNYYLPNSWISN